MAVSTSQNLDWAVIRLGADMNWWVEEISDEIHWDLDGLGIIDPNQISYVIDQCDPLREYGFDGDIFEGAFFTFAIDGELKDGRVRLRRVPEPLLESEDKIFALPNVMDEEKGPYADLVDHLTKLRVKLLNDLIDFEQVLTVDEVEEELRDSQSIDFMEGRGVHFFTELTTILEFVPEGFELDLDAEEESASTPDKDDLEDFPDVEVEEEEKIAEDDTMKWDDESGEEDEEEEDEDSEFGEDEEEDEEENGGGQPEAKRKASKR